MQGRVSGDPAEPAGPDGSPCLHVSQTGFSSPPSHCCCPAICGRRLPGANGPASLFLGLGISLLSGSSVPQIPHTVHAPALEQGIQELSSSQ